MRAKEEYKIWLYKEKIISADTMVELAYTTGFSRAIELMELFLKEKQNENNANIS
jgi:predicted HTH domain antitoxin